MTTKKMFKNGEKIIYGINNRRVGIFAHYHRRNPDLARVKPSKSKYLETWHVDLLEKLDREPGERGGKRA